MSDILHATPRSPGAAGSAGVRVNYSVNRRRFRGKIEHRSGSLLVRGAWESAKTHERIFRRILKKNPGWMVTGWALAPAPNAQASATEAKHE